MKNKINLHSMMPKIFIYLMVFAVIVLALTWALQNIFMNTFYERMKIREINSISRSIEEQYEAKDENLGQEIQELATKDDVYVIIETYDGSITFSPNEKALISMDTFRNETNQIKQRLFASTGHSVSIKLCDKNTDKKTLAYGKLLGSGNNDYVLLYIISPLYPMNSTISILQSQLLIVTIIALILAVILSFFLSRRISNPLSKITRTAAQLGRGNYDISFEAESFTEIEALADTLNAVTVQLDKTNQYQRDLIANVSHDLKTPLTMIRSYAELIHDISGDNPQKRNQHLQVIIDETDRLNNLVEDMTSLSKLQSGQMVLNKASFVLQDCITSVMETYEIMAQQEDYNFKVEMLEKPISIFGDEGKLTQVINNLISNAVKYCGEDKEIEIKLVNAGGQRIRLEISDHGKGIKSDELPHIWDRYYKASTNHVRPTEGSGLGLSICKEILMLHNYKYGVDSQYGSGSTFWFEAPYKYEKSE